ncbi:glycoside hydrolase domain-containing protein [Streptomyces sp. NBC_01198]|uniref:glycoside hydrolase domain-containing protein n=1 Tax=Streptomyces sp. NBC_01198 TaxID=2903769 RepID=UPI002E1487C5|nr:DUF1906 domain-containing protein [Streptomyces sp. NBC_01198]
MRKRLLFVASAALTALGASGLGGGPAQAAAPALTRQVSYADYVFTVPASWQVVDLGESPRSCVRFDQHTVYLGHPGASQDCPSDLIGRTESLLVEPAVNPASQQGTTADLIGHEYDVRAADLTVTATYDTDADLVQNILSDAGLPMSPPQGKQAQHPLAAAALPATVTNYTGKGFDACAAPSAGAMNAWNASSPYGAVGIYIGGSQRACAQPNLTAAWVTQQASAGWRFVPLYVGLQASDITSSTAQGTSAADDAVSHAGALGLSPGSTLYYDMEAYSSSYSATVLSFESAWTKELHAKGYRSAIYSSSSSGIQDLVNHYTGYAMPDAIFDALWNGAANTTDPVVPAADWGKHQRVHQYSGGTLETWGGTSINIDRDYLDVQFTTDTAAHGRVWDRSRASGGAWAANATLIDDNDGINFVAAGSLPNGTEHVETLINGDIWDRTRNADGTWSGGTKIDDQGAIVDVAGAGLPNGTYHVLSLVNGEVWDRTRNAGGTWSGGTEVDAQGSITDVAAAALPNGDLYVAMVVNGEIWVRHRTGSTGAWSGSTEIDAQGAIADVALAALPNGTLHVLSMVNGEVWDRTRNTDGTWSGGTKVDGGGPVTQISATGLPNGEVHVATVAGGQVWDRARSAAGTWSASATKVDANGQIFATYLTALPDGSLHLGTNA